jgi:uncharacterized membrane protein YgdD (TMEM256/DUF423 family)
MIRAAGMHAILLVVAGLMGAAGVILAAAGAHAASGAGLESASAMLLFHACATIGTVLALRSALLWPPLGTLAAAGFVLGAILFAGDLSLRALAGQRLFPMAAPSGGFILIASWLALSVAAACAALRR